MFTEIVLGLINSMVHKKTYMKRMTSMFLQMQIPKDAFDKINLVHRKFYVYKGSQAFFANANP